VHNLKSASAKLNVTMFLLPAIVIYLTLLIIPLLAAIYFSFMDWNGISGSPLVFVGMDNYLSAFRDPAFRLALGNMLRMVVFSVLFHTPIALLLAVALNSRFRGFKIFKILFFVPTVFPLASIGLMWYFVFMPTGSLNAMFKALGLLEMVKPWLVSPDTAMNTIIFVNIWAGIGYFLVILLAGLTTIPDELYEAAAIDGAGSVNKFFNITIPMLKPTLFMCILLDIIGSVKVFDLVFAMTGGGPNGLTNLPTTLMYNEAFKYNHYGTGSAIGIIILIICLLGTAGSNGLMRRSSQKDGV
jgi:ABC-type sugar transport system permease subunit